MHKMLIVNAPAFFAATWRLIKGWLDPRTAAKIEVISSRTAMQKRLLELVDPDQLPWDYGGTADDTNKILKDEFQGEADKLDSRMMYIRYVRASVVSGGCPCCPPFVTNAFRSAPTEATRPKSFT